MPTMTVPVEVEATPELIEQHLRDYAEKLKGSGGFPVPPGTMVDLDPKVAAAITALHDAKVLVVEASAHTPHALIAFIKAAGGFGTFWGMASQIKRPEEAPPPT